MKCTSCGNELSQFSTVCGHCGKPVASMEAAAQAGAPRGSWLSRHWGKALAIGCFGLILAFAALATLIVMVAFGAMKSSDVYKTAVGRAKANPAVVEKLGTPIAEGFFVSGNIESSPGRGEAKLTIPISGPKGSASIYADATKRGGDWEFSVLEVAIEGEAQKIDLLEGEPPEE
ncbi:MAG: cytochrome c oxidase assembly factor 1 family protein [Acidobacteria bacterium]|nr:cytochrome c oxidase assembly factor 1 family protein [Acidobacteriota bacterium]